MRRNAFAGGWRGMSGRGILAGTAGCALVLGALAGCGSSDDGTDSASGGDVVIEDGSGAAQDAEVETDQADAQSLLAEAQAGTTLISCDVSDSDGTEATVFIRGNTMRVDSVTPEGTQHMLTTDEATYIWSDGQPGGMRIDGNLVDLGQQMAENLPFDPETLDFLDEADTDGTDGTDESLTDADCSVYGDDTVLDVPSDRDFVSIGDMMGGMPAGN